MIQTNKKSIKSILNYILEINNKTRKPQEEFNNIGNKQSILQEELLNNALQYKRKQEIKHELKD